MGKRGMGMKGITGSEYGVALMKNAFDPKSGPLTDKSAAPWRREWRCELFTGAFGELRNPKAHGDPTITDPLVAVEEMMSAGKLQRILDAPGQEATVVPPFFNLPGSRDCTP